MDDRFVHEDPGGGEDGDSASTATQEAGTTDEGDNSANSDTDPLAADSDSDPLDAGDHQGGGQGATQQGDNRRATTESDDDTTNESTRNDGQDDSNSDDWPGNSTTLPPGHEVGVWYQWDGTKWTNTNITDVRELGLGYFGKDDDGTMDIHINGIETTPPETVLVHVTVTETLDDEPDMGDPSDVRPETSNDDQGNPTSWVWYWYASKDDLPEWLKKYAEVGGVDPSGSYTVIPNPDGSIAVWQRLPVKPR